MVSVASNRLNRALGLIAPGTAVRDGLDRIVHGRTGALITLGNNARLQALSTGGFAIDVPFTATALRELARFGLEYAEQPCASIDELADLRRLLARSGVEVPIAADESIRRSGDPERVVARQAADVAVSLLAATS